MNTFRLALAAIAFLFGVLEIQAAGPVAAGSWSGNWVSSANGHKGPLNARMERVGADTVLIHFRGRFAKVIPFAYTARLQVVAESGDRLQLAGSQKLPLFGTFSTQGAIDGNQFHASFQSGRDSGEFHMRRVR